MLDRLTVELANQIDLDRAEHLIHEERQRRNLTARSSQRGALVAEETVAKACEIDQGFLRRTALTGSEIPAALVSAGVTVDNVDLVFRDQPWDSGQVRQGEVVREALVAAAKAILRTVPPCPARTKALDHLQDVRMDVNRAITWRGQF